MYTHMVSPFSRDTERVQRRGSRQGLLLRLRDNSTVSFHNFMFAFAAETLAH